MRPGVRILINFERELRNMGKNEICDTPAHHQNTTHTHTEATNKHIFSLIKVM